MRAKPLKLSQVEWVFPPSPDAIMAWAREQALALAERLCGEPACESRGADPGPPSLCRIAVGTPQSNPVIERAQKEKLIDVDSLADDDFILKRTSAEGQDVLLIAGRSSRAAMYGLFDLFERRGCRFLISRDVLPAGGGDVAIAVEDEVGHSDCTWRGMWFQFCFATNSSMSLADFERLFDQMAKMRLNRIVYYQFENEPFLDYSFRGERKLVGDIAHPDSGYISYGRHYSGSYLVRDIAIGRERYDREKVAPREFQGVSSSAQALETGRDFMRRLIAMAAARGIRTWSTMLPCFVPMNLTKYTRRMPRPHLHWSGLTSFTDPVLDEINRVRIQAVLEAYPGLEGLFLGIPEGYYEDPYPQSRERVERLWPQYAEALALHKRYWGAFWNHDEALLESHLRADIGFGDVAERTIGLARDVDPALRLGIITVCKAYLLTHLNSVLDRDICFADIESRSLWTKDGAPLHLFQTMRDRECMVIPRAGDDGSMAGLQFNLNLYHRDRYLKSAAENGTSGLIIQTTHVRGNEHNMAYLAGGMWRADLSPEAFYQDYAESLFGPDAAGPMLEAYDIFEHSEQLMGGRGLKNMPWNKTPMHIEVLRGFRDFPAPYIQPAVNRDFVEQCASQDPVFDRIVNRLRKGLDSLVAARPRSTRQGRGELDYLAHRTRGYMHHLSTLSRLSGVYRRYYHAFEVGGAKTVGAELTLCFEAAAEAENEARQSAEQFARCIEHPTDLGVLWMINSSMVAGTRVLRQFLGNLVAFYEGREYWNDVDWESLFGSCPFPAYGQELVPAVHGMEDEPG